MPRFRQPSWSEMLHVARTRGRASVVPNLWKDLDHWWPLSDGGSEVARDIGGRRRDGSGNSVTPSSSWTVKQPGKVLTFGSTTYLNCGLNVGQYGATDNFSFSVWFKTTKTDTGNYLLSSGRGGIFSPWFGVLFASQVMWFFMDDNTDTAIAESTSTLCDGIWHHAAGVVNRGTSLAYLYIDGILEDSESIASVGNMASGENFYIGDRDVANAVHNFEGDMSNLSLHRRALSANEVMRLYMDPWCLGRIRSRTPVVKTAAAPPATIIPRIMHHRRMMGVS